MPFACHDTWTISVENSGNADVHVVAAQVVESQCLCYSLALIIAGPEAQKVDRFEECLILSWPALYIDAVVSRCVCVYEGKVNSTKCWQLRLPSLAEQGPCLLIAIRYLGIQWSLGWLAVCVRFTLVYIGLETRAVNATSCKRRKSQSQTSVPHAQVCRQGTEHQWCSHVPSTPPLAV